MQFERHFVVPCRGSNLGYVGEGVVVCCAVVLEEDVGAGVVVELDDETGAVLDDVCAAVVEEDVGAGFVELDVLVGAVLDDASVILEIDVGAGVIVELDVVKDAVLVDVCTAVLEEEVGDDVVELDVLTGAVLDDVRAAALEEDVGAVVLEVVATVVFRNEKRYPGGQFTRMISSWASCPGSIGSTRPPSSVRNSIVFRPSSVEDDLRPVHPLCLQIWSCANEHVKLLQLINECVSSVHVGYFCWLKLFARTWYPSRHVKFTASPAIGASCP